MRLIGQHILGLLLGHDPGASLPTTSTLIKSVRAPFNGTRWLAWVLANMNAAWGK